MNLLAWGAAIGAWIGIIFVGDSLVVAVLSLLGMNVPLRFGWKRRATNAALRPLGRVKYILVSGVLLFGWPLGAGMAVSSFILHKYLAYHALILIDAPFFAIWSITGVIYGLTSWGTARDRGLNSPKAPSDRTGLAESFL
jgi:hypothetical protein